MEHYRHWALPKAQESKRPEDGLSLSLGTAKVGFSTHRGVLSEPVIGPDFNSLPQFFLLKEECNADTVLSTYLPQQIYH